MNGTHHHHQFFKFLVLLHNFTLSKKLTYLVLVTATISCFFGILYDIISYFNKIQCP